MDPLEFDLDINFDDPYLCFTCGESPCDSACMEEGDAALFASMDIITPVDN